MPRPESSRNSYIVCLTNRDFLLFYLGQYISFIGDRIAQVAFLAPTTVLAAQHLRVLQKRMGSDVRVELLSSLVKRTRDETAALREDMADPEGNVDVVGRKSPHSLFDEKIATFEDDGGTYDQADAEGFIKLNALRLRNLARKRSQS